MSRFIASLHRYLDVLPIPAVLIDVDGRVEYVNRPLTEQYGYELADIPDSKKWADQAYPDLVCRERLVESWIPGLAKDEQSRQSMGPVCIQFRCKDGTLRWVLVTARSLDTKRLLLIDDQTEWMLAQEALRDSEDFLNTTGKLAKVGGWQIDAETMAVRWTKESYRIHEMPLDYQPELDPVIEFYEPEDQPMMRSALMQALHHGTRFNLELRFVSATGRRLWMRVVCRPVMSEGRVVRLLGTFQDVSDRKLVDAALAESEERYRAIVEMAADGIVTTDQDGVILSFNRAACSCLGFTVVEVLGKSLSSLFAEEQRDLVGRLFQLAMGTTHRGRSRSEYQGEELLGRHQAGHLVPLSVKLSLVHLSQGQIVMALLRDLTEEKRSQADQRRLEEQLYQVQKMEALGVLAGGIAHDFNNILSSILGFSQLAQEWSRGQDKLQRALHQISMAGNRARELVKQILTFSRRGEESKEYFELAEIVREAERLLRGSMPKHIKFSFRSAGGEHVVHGVSSQLHQVLINLCTNAFQAMPEGGSLELLLETVDWLSGDSSAPSGVLLSPGRYHRLLVRDSGVGIPPDVMKRIFEPFFTTKGTSGTGLGLAVAHGIVNRHGGALGVRSASGCGTEFLIYLPAASRHAPLRQRRHATPQLRGTGQVMLVDDEPSVLAIMQSMLEELGFTVHSFQGSLAALAAFDASPQLFDWVLTDLRMPDLDGAELSERLHKVRPDLPVVVLSAVIHEADQKRLESAHVSLILSKPITLTELSERLSGLSWIRHAAS